MSFRTVTEWIEVLGVLGLIVYTIVMYAFAGNASTVSRVARDNAINWPVVALGVGMVAGHWYGPGKTCSRLFLAAIGLTAVLLDSLNPALRPATPFLGGWSVGAVFWSQAWSDAS